MYFRYFNLIVQLRYSFPKKQVNDKLPVSCALDFFFKPTEGKIYYFISENKAINLPINCSVYAEQKKQKQTRTDAPKYSARNNLEIQLDACTENLSL